MLEYETANPGQDATKPQGEHFDPELNGNNPRVSFAPGDYAMEERNIGMPREYGTESRPYSSSPAPPNPNDQFTGLAEGGMHADENERVFKQSNGDAGSDQTLTHGDSNMMSQVFPNTTRSAMRHGNSANNASNTIGGRENLVSGRDQDRSLRSNTQMNRNMNSGAPSAVADEY